MEKINVNHKKLGEGAIVSIENGIVAVDFGDKIREFQLDTFSSYFTFVNEDLKLLIDNVCVTNSSQNKVRETVPIKKSVANNKIFRGCIDDLIGARALSISFPNDSVMFQIIGYLAHPGRIASIEAEVPRDGRDVIFEQLFPGQVYRPIEVANTPSGMPNKISTQFRINFANLSNCPQILKANMGVGNGRCVGRINRSRFVLRLVQHYGFRFGHIQNIAVIRKIAQESGFINDFERGYSL